MEVGILTMHRVVNYGSFMQAYALKRVIESFGGRVTFRDFHKGEPRHKGQKVSSPSLKERISGVRDRLLNNDDYRKRRAFWKELDHKYNLDYLRILGVTSEPLYDLSADVMVIGSDEVFNYTQNHRFGYVPCLFGHDIEAQVIFSYAASAGYADHADVVADGMTREISEGLNRMKFISVRDENTRRLVRLCTGNDPPLVLDPTLIFDFEDLLPRSRFVADDYILVYAYEGRMDAEEEIQAIRKFAAGRRLKIISAGAFHSWCDENIVVSPFELLRVFKDAAFVVTDTFHGSIFSMKTGAQFATFIRDKSPRGSNSNKVRYLLRQTGFDSRAVNDVSQLEDVLTTSASFSRMNEMLIESKKLSIDFIRTALL